MQKMITTLLALGTAYCVGVAAEEAKEVNSDEKQRADVYERMESPDLSTRWEAAGGWLDSIHNNPGERANMYRE